ncbi:MAG: toll/interleukin-1 receptor domain-containing protein, partial [Candidatus Acidiferrales bacterium]
MAFDVFISYASKDKIVADAVCARLEASGIRCWIAPRDIVAGRSYGEAIIEAIHGAKVMVLVFSSSANASGHIPKEVERAVSNGVAVLPFRIEDVAPGKSLDYFIGSVHWLDAMTPPMEKHLDNLAATVHKLLPVKMGETAPPTDATVMWQRNAAGGAAATAGAA